jgi:putative transposase
MGKALSGDRPGLAQSMGARDSVFAFAPGIRKMIYTTNAVEALNRSLRKIIKTRGSFPNDEAALKLIYLAIRNAGMRWRRAIEWTKAMGQSAIKFGDRFPPSAN